MKTSIILIITLLLLSCLYAVSKEAEAGELKN